MLAGEPKLPSAQAAAPSALVPSIPPGTAAGRSGEEEKWEQHPAARPWGAFTTAWAVSQPFCILLPRCGTDAASQGPASGWQRERFPTSPAPSLNEAESPPSHS